MHPAFSVIFLTTLIGAGQGLFLALVTAQLYAAFDLLPRQPAEMYVIGSGGALLLLLLGLGASFFHLGHPERAWRAAARWRTSWLSREVIALPLTMGAIAAYGAAHLLEWHRPVLPLGDGLLLDPTLAIGLVGALLGFALYVCTAMIYACLRFLQEWATPLTPINFVLIGGASGFTLAAALAAGHGWPVSGFFGGWALLLTLLALVGRAASLWRNARLKPKSSVQSAIGVRHRQIVQKAQGSMGGSFNTREFFHGVRAAALRRVKWGFLLIGFFAPLVLLASGLAAGSTELLANAFAVQYLGLLAERWFFFAQANHPQNLYYQQIS